VSLVVLLVNALVGDTGYLATLRVERDETALRAEYYRLHQENARLKAERVRLDRDPAALEEAARSIGLIRDGETLVTITALPGGTSTPGEPAR
jgi:cell division protein FtsB